MYTGPLFKVDDYISAREGTIDERQALVRELVEELTATPIQQNKDSQGREYSFYRKVYPLVVDGNKYEIIASFYLDHHMLAVAVVDPLHPGETPIVLQDEGLTGTPNVHQLPIQLQDKKIPQGFGVFSEDPIATKLYYGLLKHMLSKF